MNWYNETITTVIENVAKQNHNLKAIIQGNKSLTYENLLNKASRVATGMRNLGITIGEHIGVLHPNDIVVPVLHHASACLGTVYVPFNVMFSPRELRDLLKHSDISVLFVGGEYKGKHLAEHVLEVLPELSRKKDPKLDLPEHPKLKWIVQVDDKDPFHGSFLSLDELEETGAKDTLPFVNRTPQPESVSHLLYTSGTTAFPKGVLLTHRGVLGGSFYWGEAHRLTDNDRCLSLLPFYHTSGLIVQWLSIHLRGGPIHILEKYHRIDVKEVLETVERERITVMGAFDTLLLQILEHPERGQYDLSSWEKTSSFPGSSYDIRVKAGLKHIVCLYSLTEASNPVSLVMPEDERYDIRRKSVGRPLPGVEVKIVDPESEQVLPPGVSGEILFRGWNRLVGYYKPGPEEVTDKIFDKEGYLKTGDRGYLDNEGYLYFQGKYKDVIKTGGENVSPLEIENILLSELPGIVQAQVVGISDELWGEAVTAFIEIEPIRTFTVEDVLKTCREKLASFKVPKYVFFIKHEDWPMTSTGKIRKEELRRRVDYNKLR